MVTQLIVGADHRGREKLQALCARLQEVFPDLKIEQPWHHERADDHYNLAASQVAEAVAAQPTAFGLLICGSGHGMCMQANRFTGVRAINAPSVESAVEGRAHSDANVLCLAADYLEVEVMLAIAQAFLETQFLDKPRYRERIRLLDLAPLLETDVLPELSHFQMLPGVTQGVRRATEATFTAKKSQKGDA